MCKEVPKERQPQPGEGLRSLRTTGIFRAVNFELYARPNIFIIGLGLIGITISLGYIGYMRHKYEGMGYYSAVKEDGTETFTKKKSKWDL